jgi:quinohemoprotein ethanol dehydrogenase
MCHGADLVSPGSPAPDLRESAIALSAAALGRYLRSGALVQYGMPKFDELTDEQVNGLFMYIRSSARKALRESKTYEARQR